MRKLHLHTVSTAGITNFHCPAHDLGNTDLKLSRTYD